MCTHVAMGVAPYPYYDFIAWHGNQGCDVFFTLSHEFKGIYPGSIEEIAKKNSYSLNCHVDTILRLYGVIKVRGLAAKDVYKAAKTSHYLKTDFNLSAYGFRSFELTNFL